MGMTDMKEVLYSQIPRKRHGTLHRMATSAQDGHMGKHQRQSGGREWARAFIAVSVERNGQGRVSRFRID